MKNINKLWSKKALSSTLIGIFIILILIISVGPFLWVFSSSFKENIDIVSGTLGFSNGFKLENYKRAFEIAPLVKFYFNSIVVALLGTGLNLILMAMAAYVVVRFPFKGSNTIKMLFTSVLFIPGASLLYPLYMIVNKIHLYDNIFGLVLVYAGLGMATSFFIIMSYYLTVPKELEEAAYIDGASFITTFVKIILPITKPCFATAGVLQFLMCWNEFQFALVLTTGNQSRTLPIALYYFTSQFASDYGAMFAATVLVALPSVILYCLLQEQVVSGLASGSVKG
ncbi:carbohydrate ABC transporter permease [Clostridium sediminicola]|uniref:carbohydrate ABC transporter permease n=1 Tax=Clostridium sediminicola TaxID=3114879 RepID=UPI0031F21C7C